MNMFCVYYKDISRNILISISTLSDAIVHYLSKFTLYEMIHHSDNFEDVKKALTERTNWSIMLASIPFTPFSAC